MNKHYIIPLLAFAFITALLFYSPVPQKETYHDFIDQRSILGVPNFWNVITNLPFAMVDFLGLPLAATLPDNNLRMILVVLFAAFILLFFGSSYYHLRPNNVTLVYDRIPIGIIISSFFAFIVYDRINVSAGNILFFVLLTASVLSVLYWIFTEGQGRGDLRWYAFVQFFLSLLFR